MNRPDGLHSHKPHPAPAKSFVSAVLSATAAAGNTLVTLLASLLAATLILYSGYVLYDNHMIEEQAFSGNWEVMQYKPELKENGDADPLAQSDGMEEIKEDYRGWLTVNDTPIDYPVMQGPDDVYYSNHDIYGAFSLSGAIYLSAGNTPDLTDAYNLIYGHHMDNGAMFGSLDGYLEPDYFDAHREGVLVSPAGVFDLNVFAVIQTDAYFKTVYETGPDRTVDEILLFLQDPQEKATVCRFDRAAADGAKKIVALSTCADATTNGRLVVFCVATRRNLLTVEFPSYTGVYDAQTHSSTASVNYPEGTSIQYSLEPEKRAWSSTPPSIRDVGSLTVYVRAQNEIYGVAETTGTLTVTPAPVVVTAANSSKTYGDPDPVFTAVVSGVLDDYQIMYMVSREGSDEAVGVYPGVIVPSGPAVQGNYTVQFVPGDFTITASGSLSLAATGYDGVYDGNTQFPGVAVSDPDGTTIYYSTDNGETWSTTPPSICDVGYTTVLIQAVNPNYEPVTVQITLCVRPRPVLVIADPSEKDYGAEDPQFTATVTGLIDDFQIVYTVSRPGAGTDEEAGTYVDAIIPSGEALQGNYAVSYYPADFTIKGTGKPIDSGDPDAPGPKAPTTDDITKLPILAPAGQGLSVWALLNLVCVLLTIYLLLPVLHLRDKYGRIRLMDRANETAGAEGSASHADGLSYRVRQFRRRFRIGLFLEILAAAASVAVFVLTENMRLPMVLIDRWTPLMLSLLLAAWIIDLRLSRYRENERDAAEDAR